MEPGSLDSVGDLGSGFFSFELALPIKEMYMPGSQATASAFASFIQETPHRSSTATWLHALARPGF